MKIFFTAIMVALTFLTMSLQAQQASDGVAPEAETALAKKFEALSPEVATSLAAKGSNGEGRARLHRALSAERAGVYRFRAKLPATQASNLRPDVAS